MSKASEWYGYAIYTTKGPSVYFAGNNISNVRRNLKDDLQILEDSIYELVSGTTLDAETAVDAIEHVQNGDWRDTGLPLADDVRRPPSSISYHKLVTK